MVWQSLTQDQHVLLLIYAKRAAKLPLVVNSQLLMSQLLAKEPLAALVLFQLNTCSAGPGY